jgi:hypothetical protein
MGINSGSEPSPWCSRARTDGWQRHRKIYHSLLGMHNSKIFQPYQEYESRQTLTSLLEAPDMFYQEMARYSASVTFSLL